MPAWTLKLAASGITLLSAVGSFAYVGAYPKNPLAPLQPPVVGVARPPEFVEVVVEEVFEEPTPIPTPTPTPTPSQTPARATAAAQRTAAATPRPTPTPSPVARLTPAVRTTTKQVPVTNTYVS